MDQTNTTTPAQGEPAQNNPPVGGQAAEPASKPDIKKGKKILVIEDEESLSQALSLKLGASGYQVTVAANGRLGLEAIAKESFDLILLDLILPEVDGFTVLAKLRDQGNKIPVVVLSNLNQEEDIAKVKALGAKDFLVKSNIQLSKILEYLKNFL